ncbi:MAG: amphi-Trp domain-containing protein [Deltaproteobacteria bacterium]|jgi:amphi-Trp domain-containing protein|nr:amphi-Trp domain-containing protein [Deltaproteobacteria bacterium]
MSSNNFRHSFSTDPEDVARYLDALIEGFRDRKLTFRSQQRKVTLEPADVMDMSIETSARRGRTRLTLSFSWDDDEGLVLPQLPLGKPPAEER